jgi:nucleoid-associated protein YgaU
VVADHAAPRADEAVAGLDLDRPVAAPPSGWSPDRPAAPHRRTAGSEAAVRLVATTPHAEHRVLDEVVVRRGDTLWDVAARHLRGGSSAAEIAAEWPRWYAANRDVIGDDPDLLRPGQRLAPPV